MSHGLTERDIQAGINDAWHKKTHVVDTVTRDNSMPWDVSPHPVFTYDPKSDNPEDLIEIPKTKILMANDDGLPVGQPYADTYHPSTVDKFWNIIKKSLSGIEYKVISAGSIFNRQRIFASIKLTDSFYVGDREFKDYLTIIDSFDKSTSLQCKYNNICVVCANTFAVSMQAGQKVGRVKHTKNLDSGLDDLIESIKKFTHQSEIVKSKLHKYHQRKVSNDEARAWFTAIESGNLKEITNGAKQKVARLMELYESGKGNQGETQLDVFSAYTEFYTHESSNRKEEGSQYIASEWGTSATKKSQVFNSFESKFDDLVAKGDEILENEKTLDVAVAS